MNTFDRGLNISVEGIKWLASGVAGIVGFLLPVVLLLVAIMILVGLGAAIYAGIEFLVERKNK